jgi:hypothetical protein
MQKLKLFLTFDHELPLGGISMNYAQAMFDPTEKVLKVAEEENVRVTLFTDILCALRFKEWDNEGFYKPYTEQLKRAILKGHDVQLHLHPHWLTSTYSNGSFIPSNDFALSDFKNKKYPDNIAGIIERGISLLQTICKEANPNYKCIAFRAGGYNISSPEFIFPELHKNGIRFDSSICKGYYFKSSLSEINFSDVPSLPNWFIGKDGMYNRNAPDGILEIPVGARPRKLFEIPTRFKLKKYRDREPENRGIPIHEGKGAGLKFKIKQALSARMLSFDNYTYSASHLMNILDHHVNQYSNTETIMVSAIGHPKSMDDYALSLMKSFIGETRKNYGSKAEFITFSDLGLKQELK